MRKQIFILFILSFIAARSFAQQQPLPFITVRNINNKIIISWVNNYVKPVTALNIQRSYDSLKNYTTIGSVLSPQSHENGYTDDNPPYNKMYYRVFVSFEGGSYIFTAPVRPVKEFTEEVISPDKYPWMFQPGITGKDSIGNGIQQTDPVKNGITYPSQRIFTAKDNNIVIHLPDAAEKKYLVKFFDETDKFLFELNKLKEEYLIIEKVNFVHPGWFRFEVYENGVLIENNKFQIVKDVKKL